MPYISYRPSLNNSNPNDTVPPRPPAGSNGSSTTNSTSTSTGRYVDPYDTRIGNGALPAGIQGSANRAYTGEVLPGQTSYGLLNNYMADGSPIMKNAELRALEGAADAGLSNSSIAIGAAQRAAMESLQPYALQDSNLYADQKHQNVQVLNERQALLDNFKNQESIANLNNIAATGQYELQRQMQRERLAFEGEQQGLDRALTQSRDYYGYQYDLGRQNNQSYNALRNYAAQTGIDMRTQGVNFMNNLQNTALQYPDIFTPEYTAAFASAWLPMYDEMAGEFDSYFNSVFNGDW